MKKIFLIIILLLLLILVIDSIKYINEYNQSVEIAKQLIEKGNYDGVNVTIPQKIDVFLKMDDYYRNGFSNVIIFIYPLLLIVIGTCDFHKKLQSGFFKNIIIRKDYRKYINKEIFHSWRAALLIPMFMIIVFLFSCFVTNFNFKLNLESSNYYYILSDNNIAINVGNMIISLVLMTINLSVVSIACINVGLIFAKKNNNFIISTIVAYLFMIVYQITAEIIIGPILSKLFNDYFFGNGLTLFSFWGYDSGVTPLKLFIYGILLILSTYIFLKNSYKNKENVIIYAEK